jgi:hypothetical protein
MIRKPSQMLEVFFADPAARLHFQSKQFSACNALIPPILSTAIFQSRAFSIFVANIISPARPKVNQESDQKQDSTPSKSKLR